MPAKTFVGAVSMCLALLTADPLTIIARGRLPLPTELSWIGLFNAELMDWLENENRLQQLCTAPSESLDWYRCRDERLAPKIAVIAVRSMPQNDGPRIGEIVLVALPGKGVKAFLSTGRLSVPFSPDLHSGDWGYGSFHQTVLDRRGTWFHIPLPSVGTAWIDAQTWTDAPSVRVLEQGEIITTPRGDMVVLGIDKDVLRVRAEQAADMNMCREGDEPPAKPEPWTEVQLPFEEIFDEAGHLLISIKYLRGC